MLNLDNFISIDIIGDILKVLSEIDYSSYFKLILISLPPSIAVIYVIFDLIRQRFTILSRMIENKFSTLPPKQIKAMSKRVKLVSFPKDKIIIQQGTPARECFILRKGSAEVFVNYDEPEQTKLGELKIDDLFGEMGLLEGRLRSATIVASEDCECVSIDAATFSEFISGESKDNTSQDALRSIRKIAMTRNKTNKAWLRLKD
jgi:CRP-like cAMP-binding protein